MKTRLHSFIVQ